MKRCTSQLPIAGWPVKVKTSSGMPVTSSNSRRCATILWRLERGGLARPAQRTFTLLQKNWPAVEAIVAELLRSKRVDGARVEQIFDQAMKPTGERCSDEDLATLRAPRGQERMILEAEAELGAEELAYALQRLREKGRPDLVALLKGGQIRVDEAFVRLHSRLQPR